MNRIKHVAIALGLAVAMFVSIGVARADFVPLPGTLVLGQDTGVFGQQTCPPPAGCIENGHASATFNVVNGPGSVSLSFIGVLDPSSTGFYTFSAQVFDPLMNLISSGVGVGSLMLPSFNVINANGYSIELDWAFSGNGLTQTASFGVVAATSTAAVVPEPGTLALMGLGLLALAYTRRKQQ